MGLRSEGDVLRVDPGWMRWTYRLLVTALVAGLLFSVLARIREYASGPAVVRLAGRTDLTATADGTVSQVAVAPGQRVEAGQLLVRFHGAREAAELARIESELELQLINRLRDPSDAGAEQALLSLRAERELARSNLAEREVRAPAAGVVSDLRVRLGQRIMPGQTLLALARGPRQAAEALRATGGGPAARRVPAAPEAGHAAAPGAPGLPLRLPASDVDRWATRSWARPRRSATWGKRWPTRWRSRARW